MGYPGNRPISIVTVPPGLRAQHLGDTVQLEYVLTLILSYQVSVSLDGYEDISPALWPAGVGLIIRGQSPVNIVLPVLWDLYIQLRSWLEPHITQGIVAPTEFSSNAFALTIEM